MDGTGDFIFVGISTISAGKIWYSWNRNTFFPAQSRSIPFLGRYTVCRKTRFPTCGTVCPNPGIETPLFGIVIPLFGIVIDVINSFSVTYKGLKEIKDLKD